MNSPESGDLRTGALLGAGRYRLIKLLGQGGMGMVWLAFDQRLGEKVALKLLSPEIRADPVALDDLRRETARSHRLAHPNIVRIHDLHEQEGEPAFISMEYVEGPNLSELRLQQPDRVLRWEMLGPLIEQLCAALEYAHGERVIHRDLKPANLMLDGRGRLKLADFGIAAVASDSLSRVSVRRPTSGTLSYMSPQQMAGQGPRATDDVYALGATLYELLTSRPPFYTGDLPYQVREVAPQPVTERLAELEIANDVPADVAALLMACLAKDPGSRPQSAKAVAAWISYRSAQDGPKEVRPIADAQPTLATENAVDEAAATPEALGHEGRTPAVRWAWLVAAMAISVMLFSALGAWYWRRVKEAPEATRQRYVPSAQKEVDAAAEARRFVEAWTQARRAGQGYTVDLGGNVKLELVYIQPGKFTMGSPASEEGRWGVEGSQTQVTLSRGFWLGRTEVTQRQYEAVMGSNPSIFKSDPSRPVEMVSWLHATNFCGRLTERERAGGRLPAGYVYRLPTEAQWEYACRAGTTTRFSYGDDPGYGQLSKYAWYDANSGNQTHPVRTKLPNPWGLHDMQGNVWEWCLDWKDTYPGGSVTDPRGPASGSSRVFRGGGWRDGGRICRAANRGGDVPSLRSFTLGFRVALVAVP